MTDFVSWDLLAEVEFKDHTKKTVPAKGTSYSDSEVARAAQDSLGFKTEKIKAAAIFDCSITKWFKQELNYGTVPSVIPTDAEKQLGFFQIGKEFGTLQAEVAQLRILVASLKAKLDCKCSHKKASQAVLSGWFCSLPYTCSDGNSHTTSGTGDTKDDAYNDAYKNAVYGCYDFGGLKSVGTPTYEPINSESLRSTQSYVTKTDQVSEEVATLVPDTGPLSGPCSEGGVRVVHLNGKCYCQVCCGGIWTYVKRGNSGSWVECGQDQLYNCGGEARILHCRGH